MKKILTLFAFALSGISVFAQQDPQFTQYMHNKLFMNPGYAGMKHSFCFTGIGRQQWAGFDGSPRSGVFSADLWTPQFGGGIGLNVMYDKLGFENNARYEFDYSFHLQEVLGGQLGIGIGVGAYSKRVGPGSGEQWQSTTNWTQDPHIPPQLKQTVMDFGFGLWYQRGNSWLGLSSTHLNGKNVNAGTTFIGSPPIMHTLLYQVARHYFITGGTVFFPGNTWELHPSFLVKTDATITTFDLNATAVFNQRFWFGVSYRYQDAVCPMIGFQMNGKGAGTHFDVRDEQGGGKGLGSGILKMGFAYDYTTSGLRSYQSGTFELFVNYCIPVSRGHGESFNDRLFD